MDEHHGHEGRACGFVRRDTRRRRQGIVATFVSCFFFHRAPAPLARSRQFPNTPWLFRSGLDLVERTPNSSAGFTPNFSASRSGLRIDDELNSALLPGDGESQIPQTLALAPQSIDLSVRLAWNGVVYQLKNIQYDARISQLKEAIAATLCNETGQRWSLNDLVFVYYGRVLNDAWTVVDCNVPFGSIIHAQERNGAGPRAARQNNEGSVVYTVPAPMVRHAVLCILHGLRAMAKSHAETWLAITPPAHRHAGAAQRTPRARASTLRFSPRSCRR